MEEIVKKRMISLPEVKEILSEGNPESLDQIQRWTFDYVSKFAKIEPKAAKKMKQELTSQCGLITRITFIHFWMEKTNSLRNTGKDPQNN